MYFIEERIKTICTDICSYVYADSIVISDYMFKEGNFKSINEADSAACEWKPFKQGDIFLGGNFYWFRTRVELPDRFLGNPVVYELKTGAEGAWSRANPQILVCVDRNIIQGLDANHREVVLTDKADKKEYEIDLHVYTGAKGGIMLLDSKAALADRDVERVYYNLKVPLEVALLLKKENKKRIDILNYLNQAVNIIDLRKPFSDSFINSVKEANKFLETEFYGKFCGEQDATVHCVGHTHIDVAWKWTLARTKEKVARSFSTVLSLMEQYPEFKFMSSQPQLYQFIKEDHPELYEEIKKRVAEKRWEPEGGMWLEADCNLASGESLIRQVLFGKRFFKEEFGVDSKILWLPDVFGYSAALPQILKKSGIDYFMTTKISWSEYNKMPYDTFLWRGLDGTEILTHFITTPNEHLRINPFITTYNGEIVPSQVMGAWERYQQKDINTNVLLCFGYGDGGGGPTKEMLENARRMEKGIPGCPQVKMCHSKEYFDKLFKNVCNNKKLPKWVGELYLEYHRGTYTSMARNKRYNRKSEFMYQDAEWLSVLNMKTSKAGYYPYERLNKGWELILLNQFHDILPGSSIKEVYDDSGKDYIYVLENGKALIEDAIDSVSNKIDLQNDAVVVFNQSGQERSDIAKFVLPDYMENVIIRDTFGSVLPSQIAEGKEVIFFAENVPAKGYKVFYLKEANSADKPTALTDKTTCLAHNRGLQNKFFEIELDDNANIISIFDKVNKRQVLKRGEKGNVLQAFEDKPRRHDAWDINIYYQEKMWEVNDVLSIEVVENGPVRACIKVEKQFLDSKIVQHIYVYNDIPRIDFDTTIDWKEKQVLLKVAFPVDIHADKAVYEIQHGNVERPTHWNTSWDLARFEVCAHKWADLSECGYGVSLMNDCKYGYDIKDSVMRLTLIKSAVFPNIDADREVHKFIYSLYPHAKDWKMAGTASMAYALNCPMYCKVERAHKGKLPTQFSLVNVNRDNVVLDVVKKAEDSDDILLRLYEIHNRRTDVIVTLSDKIDKALDCDLMENVIGDIETDGNCFSFEIKPYEIKTFMLRMTENRC